MKTSTLHHPAAAHHLLIVLGRFNVKTAICFILVGGPCRVGDLVKIRLSQCGNTDQSFSDTYKPFHLNNVLVHLFLFIYLLIYYGPIYLMFQI